jgi:hypothetical protein
MSIDKKSIYCAPEVEVIEIKIERNLLLDQSPGGYTPPSEDDGND